MTNPKCPGQDLSRWKPEDIGFVACPECGSEVEIWKDEPFRSCPDCGQKVDNPSIDRGCAEWCPSAESCLGEESPADSND